MGPSYCPDPLQQAHYGIRLRGIFEVVERGFWCEAFKTGLGEGDVEGTWGCPRGIRGRDFTME